jgi:hypothetical protein
VLDMLDEAYGDRRYMGLPLRVAILATPLIVLLGLGYVMVTLPGLFGAASELPGLPGFAEAALGWFGGLATGLGSAAAQVTDTPVGAFLLGAALLATPALLLAAGVRSARSGSVKPLLTATGGVVAGFLLVGAVTWLAYGVIQLWRFAQDHPMLVLLLYLTVSLGLNVVLYSLATEAPAGVVLAVLGTVGLCALWLLVPQIAEFLQAHLTVAVVILVALGAIAQAVFLFAADAPGFAVFVLLVGGGSVALVLFAWGFLLALAAFGFGIAVLVYTLYLGHSMGALTFGPLITAREAGSGAGSCLDTSAGVGICLGLIALAASLDPTFNQTLAEAWPGLAPGGSFPTLWFPDAVGHDIAPAVEGFVVVADGTLLAVITGIAVASLLARRDAWDDDVDSTVLVPLLVSTGTVLLTLLLARAANEDDGA